MKLLLDTNTLTELCHPHRGLRVRRWFEAMHVRHTVFLSGVAEYELRRELVRNHSVRALDALENLAERLPYVPMDRPMWKCAAVVWADQVAKGRMPAQGISGDTLLAAQALVVRAVVITENLKHFEGIVLAMSWTDVPIG